MNQLIKKIFNCKDEKDFNVLALEVFVLQHRTNKIYREFCDLMKIKYLEVNHYTSIPFLPIGFFKSKEILCNSEIKIEPTTIFTSSGTTGELTSKHFVTDISVYKKSFLKSFENFYGNLNEYCVLALLPSYLEREGSSLVYMVKEFIERTEKNGSGFFLHNIFELKEKLLWLKEQKQKTLLLGVTYALLDLSELQIELDENFIVMETGGMKGKRKEMLREELHEHLCKKLGVKKIHSEYGMTELLSQAYSSGNGIFETPPWMKILIRDPYEPSLLLSENKTGAINVIDLANIHSCSFIATQDLGKNCSNEKFEILGRIDNSDLRGCNLMVE